ncbi:MAG: hypothetical protein GYA29_02500 [Methanothrix sp.]|jgi:hypothetical protein|nr:hypothetical protein [Methanothrix sp.]
MKGLIRACILGAGLILVLTTGCLAYEFGSKVAAKDVDRGLPLQSFPVTPVIRYLDRLSNGYDANDIVYLDIINLANAVVDEGDIRLSAFGHFAPGTTVRVSDRDCSAKLSDFINPSIVFLGLHEPYGYDFNDPVYCVADVGMQRTQTNDLRLNTVSGLAAGTKVLDLDPDNNKPFTEMPLWWCFMYYDLKSSGYGIEDKVYIHTQQASPRVMENDVRLSI